MARRWDKYIDQDERGWWVRQVGNGWSISNGPFPAKWRAWIAWVFL